MGSAVPAERLAVVGAGIAGLTAAAELAPGARVTVLDRLPVAGGVLGYEAPIVEQLVARCDRAGVQWMLGATAIRWADRRLLTVGPDGIRWLACDRLVYAGGTRPATQAELRITGPRLAGVLPATVALHFAEARVILGRRIVFVGAGDWAHAAAEVIAEQDCHITVVATEEAPPPAFRHEALISGWVPSRVAGAGRVGALFLERAGHEHRLSCDAVVLASAPKALRNIDGAVFDPSDGVTFVQPVGDRTTDSWAAAQAAAAVRPLAQQSQIEVSV